MEILQQKSQEVHAELARRIRWERGRASVTLAGMLTQGLSSWRCNNLQALRWCCLLRNQSLQTEREEGMEEGGRREKEEDRKKRKRKKGTEGGKEDWGGKLKKRKKQRNRPEIHLHLKSPSQGKYYCWWFSQAVIIEGNCLVQESPFQNRF